MADSVRGPSSPKTPEDLTRPDVGFHDDKVGAQVKNDEAARKRSAQAKLGERPKRIEREPQQVMRAASFQPAHQQQGPAHEQARRQRALVAGQPPLRRQAPGRAQAAAGTRDAQAARTMGRVHTLFGAMVRMRQAPAGTGEDLGEGAVQQAEDEFATQGPTHRRVTPKGEDEQDQNPEGDPEGEQELRGEGPGDDDGLDEPQSGTRAFSSPLARAEQEARYHLQHLIAGGSGFALAGSAQQAFAEFFSRIEQWPQSVAPGHRPESDEEFNQFFQWVFAPFEFDKAQQEQLLVEISG